MEKIMNENPLTGYFRRPAIYIKLPSGGKYYPPETLELPEGNELPVFPMTAIDEISYKTPDALFNGQAIVDVIQSCVPSIKNAWKVPSIDLDYILLSVRLASYGHELEIEATCPECGDVADYAIDIRNILDNLKISDYSKPITISDLEVGFKPLLFDQINANNLIQFEEKKILQTVENDNISDEDKIRIIANGFKKVGQLTVKAVQEGIEYIKTPANLVTDSQFIGEFLVNCEKDIYNELKKHVIKLKEQSEMPELNLECSECGHKHKKSFTLDLSNFFE
jgi:RNase P subunit RPR2